MKKLIRTRESAYTLVEILVVLGIGILLASISVPVLTSINKGADLGFASTQSEAQLGLARQMALTMNRSVEVRFYETKNSSGQLYYNAVGVYGVGEDANGDGKPDSFVLQNKIMFLPQGAVFMSGSFSSLISEVSNKGEDTIPGQGLVKYAAFCFTASGSVELGPMAPSGTPWGLTIVSRKDVLSATLPANYAVLTLNPSLGLFRLTRP